MVTTVEVKGLRELGEAFKLLASDIQNKVARAATNAGAQIIKKRAKELAPIAPEAYEVRKNKGDSPVLVQPGNIGKNIVVKRVTRTNLTSEHVVAIRGKKKDGYANRIAVLQEFGTVKQSPQPFMRPAFDQEKGFAVAAIKQKFKERIDKANRGGK